MGQCCGKEPGHIPHEPNQEKVNLIKDTEQSKAQTGENTERHHEPESGIPSNNPPQDSPKTNADQPPQESPQQSKEEPESLAEDKPQEESPVIQKPREKKQEIVFEEPKIPKKYLSFEMTNDDDARIEMIVSTIEIGSLMKELISNVSDDLQNRKEDIIPLLMKVLSGVNSQDTEENHKLLKYFLGDDEVNGLDPLDFFLYVLKLINNREALVEEDLPSFYKDGTSEITQEVLDELNNKLRTLASENYLRRLFGFGITTPYTQVCKNESCEKPLYVSVSCELDLYLTHMAKAGVTISDDLKYRLVEKKMKASCPSCKNSADDYRTKGNSTVVNVPTYFLVRVKHETEDEDLIDGATLKIADISSLTLESSLFELNGIIIKSGPNNYTTLRRQGEAFVDSLNNVFDGEVVEKAYILLYITSN
jgi:hypothetical protein